MKKMKETPLQRALSALICTHGSNAGAVAILEIAEAFDIDPSDLEEALFIYIEANEEHFQQDLGGV